MCDNHKFIAEKQHCFYAQQFVFVNILHLIIVSLCFPAFPEYVDLSHHRCYCRRGRVWWVSMWNKNWEILWKGRDVTLFCWRAVARCCACSSPISSPWRVIVVSVYVKQKKWEILWKVRDVRLFCWRAVARFCAPCGPIWLPSRLTVVRVYVKR